VIRSFFLFGIVNASDALRLGKWFNQERHLGPSSAITANDGLLNDRPREPPDVSGGNRELKLQSSYQGKQQSLQSAPSMLSV
jgi:hypothetical protein